MTKQTIKEFIESYKGFDWLNGNIVIVDKTKNKQYIIGVHHSIFKIEHKIFKTWTHTNNTMLIVI